MTIKDRTIGLLLNLEKYIIQRGRNILDEYVHEKKTLAEPQFIQCIIEDIKNGIQHTYEDRNYSRILSWIPKVALLRQQWNEKEFEKLSLATKSEIEQYVRKTLKNYVEQVVIGAWNLNDNRINFSPESLTYLTEQDIFKNLDLQKAYATFYAEEEVFLNKQVQNFIEYFLEKIKDTVPSETKKYVIIATVIQSGITYRTFDDQIITVSNIWATDYFGPVYVYEAALISIVSGDCVDISSSEKEDLPGFVIATAADQKYAIG
ncbi:hypothetical protein NST38_30680 [Paenibacillus sp. FSL H8-0104]|uniref:hypothetical protein n=1 Tax=Paenibacillus sp. FSL H8-0104 TaxID=2954509 RepID=UPI0030FD6DA0